MSKAKSPVPIAAFPPIQYVILASIIWVILALLYYLFLGLPTENTENLDGELVRPSWYRIGIYIFQTLPIATTGFLCLRNCCNPKMISNRLVWFGIGIGVISWGIGNLIFAYTELILKQPPFPSLADVFFVITYAFLSLGMAMSVIGRRLSLSVRQWLIVSTVSILALALAGFVTFVAGKNGQSVELNLETGLFITYALGDLLLVVVAAILLQAFSGGKYAGSWQLLGTGGVSMFIADLGFNYLNNIATDAKPYQSGELVELFWILAFLLFGMAAAVDLDLSLRAAARRK
jgi:hypothetical protein